MAKKISPNDQVTRLHRKGDTMNIHQLLKKIDLLQAQINKHRPLDAHMRKQVKEYFRIGLTFSSNALEGSSLTETETKIILEDEITIGGKPLREHYEAVGHGDAFNHLYDLARVKSISEADIKRLHELFYRRIDADNAGAYRKVEVIITGSKHVPPLPKELPRLMKKFVVDLAGFRETAHPVEAAAMAHKDFVSIHPFIDGNGRVGRLLMNLVLLQEGYVIALIPPVLRREYIAALEKSCENDSDFVKLMAEMVMEAQQDYMRMLRIGGGKKE